MRAPRAFACSSSSRISTPAPPAITNPSRSRSKAREAFSGVSLNPDDMAPMPSKRTDKVQSSSSQPPAKMTSCLPIWISSVAFPMQWFDVAHADEIEYLTPLILNQVARVADAVEDMALGTANGPTRFGLLLRAV